MKGKTKLAVAFVVLAVLALGLFVSITPTQANADEMPNEEISTKTYSACGGIEGCRTSCGCGCIGNPNACGCGG